jgi:predicted secreted acid phosphatase
MKFNFLKYAALIIITIIITIIGATAFRNYDNEKSKPINYHDSGKYYQDISSVIREATYYLQFRLTQNARAHHTRKLAIVMDIDETALSNYQKLAKNNFKITGKILQRIEAHGNDPAIPHTLALYSYAKDHGIAIFFITGRPRALVNETTNNLMNAGYQHWEHISFNSSNQPEKSSVSYRSKERKKIVEKGYDIIMNIGNSHASLSGGYFDMAFKLPNPFYTIS